PRPRPGDRSGGRDPRPDTGGAGDGARRRRLPIPPAATGHGRRPPDHRGRRRLRRRRTGHLLTHARRRPPGPLPAVPRRGRRPARRARRTARRALPGADRGPALRARPHPAEPDAPARRLRRRPAPAAAPPLVGPALTRSSAAARRPACILGAGHHRTSREKENGWIRTSPPGTGPHRPVRTTAPPDPHGPATRPSPARPGPAGPSPPAPSATRRSPPTSLSPIRSRSRP